MTRSLVCAFCNPHNVITPWGIAQGIFHVSFLILNLKHSKPGLAALAEDGFCSIAYGYAISFLHTLFPGWDIPSVGKKGVGSLHF